MRLDAILKPIAKDLDSVLRGLRERLERLVTRQTAAGALAGLEIGSVTHLFSSPGKLIRPALVLLSSRGAMPEGPVSETPRAVVDLGIAAELVHSASLVHDDIVDKAESRRDLPSVNQLYGNAAAVLAGDVLYAEFFMTLLGLPGIGWVERGDLFRRFAETTQRMCVGEMLAQRIVSSGSAASLGEYLAIAQRKTAELMSVCCAGGAIVRGAPTAVVDALGEFGLAFGMAFQLVDDALDGDALLAEDSDATGRAREYGRRALGSIEGLPGNAGLDGLRELCGYVLARGEAGMDRL